MDVKAYPVPVAAAPVLPAIALGSIVDAIWTGGFKKSQTRLIQISNPINAPYPNLFDRNTKTENFSFVAGRSFDGKNAVGDALKFMDTHPDAVPVLCDLAFTAQSQIMWLMACGIQRIELVEKAAALVRFSYTIVGGHWNTQRA